MLQRAPDVALLVAAHTAPVHSRQAATTQLYSLLHKLQLLNFTTCELCAGNGGDGRQGLRIHQVKLAWMSTHRQQLDAM